MRNDVVTGLVISALAHAGVLFGGLLFPNAPVVKPPVETKPLIRIDMPKLDLEEDPVPVRSDEQPVKEILPPAPTQVDTPQPIIDPDTITQPLQPPPEDLRPHSPATMIPANRLGFGPGVTIYNTINLDQQPVVRSRVAPQYPFEMRSAGESGEVVVEFIVDSAGAVVNVVAVSSTRREFESAAVEAVRKWKFKPGRKGGAAVNTRMQIPIVFSLSNPT